MRSALALVACALVLGASLPARAQLSLGRRLAAPHASAPFQHGERASTPGRNDGPLVAGAVIALAVVAAGIGTSIYAFARIQEINADPLWDAYRASVPPGTRDACAVAAGDVEHGPPGAHAHARKVCAEGSMLEVLEGVSLVTALAALGVAVGLFVALGDGSKAPRLTLAPEFGRDHAGARLTLAF